MEISSRNFLKFLKYGVLGQRPSMPLFLIFSLTSRCNMTCSHCSDDVWGDPKKEHSLQQIEQFTKEIGLVERVALTGGEPFLRDDLAEICRFFVKHNHVSSLLIHTNGYETEKICNSTRKILEYCPGIKVIVSVSIDGFRETHDCIRRSESFDNAIQTARAISNLAVNAPNLVLGDFTCTLNAMNYKEMPRLSKYLEKEFGVHLGFNLLFGKPRNENIKKLNIEALEETLNKIENQSSTSLFGRLHDRTLKDILLSVSSTRSTHPLPCKAGSLLGQIYANGDVHVCPSLPSIGNIREEEFRRIWNSEMAKDHLKAIKKRKCSCNNVCYLRMSLLGYWKLPFLMLKRLNKTCFISTPSRLSIQSEGDS